MSKQIRTSGMFSATSKTGGQLPTYTELKGFEIDAMKGSKMKRMAEQKTSGSIMVEKTTKNEGKVGGWIETVHFVS